MESPFTQNETQQPRPPQLPGPYSGTDSRPTSRDAGGIARAVGAPVDSKAVKQSASSDAQCCWNIQLWTANHMSLGFERPGDPDTRRMRAERSRPDDPPATQKNVPSSRSLDAQD